MGLSRLLPARRGCDSKSFPSKTRQSRGEDCFHVFHMFQTVKDFMSNMHSGIIKTKSHVQF